jgi:hypothetical protein
MVLRLIRILTIWVALVGLLPAAVALASVDLTVPVSTASDTSGSLWWRPAADTFQAPVLASAEAPATPLEGAVSPVLPRVVSMPRLLPIAHPVLRI